MPETYDRTRALRAAARYWEEKDADSIKLERSKLKAMVEEYLLANNTCALATGTGDYVRCTPIEYSYHDGCFWMFSEGGRKFVGLAVNPHVSLAVFDKYQGLGRLQGVQIMGEAVVEEPFSERYLAHAARKKISVDFLKGLKSPMHLICVRPTRMDCLFSQFKELGCASRQPLVLEDTGEGDRARR